MKYNIGRWLLPVVIFYMVFSLNNAQSYTLELVNIIQGCYGGEACLQQPVIRILDIHGVLAQNFNGNAFIQMDASPSGYEFLYIGEQRET